MTIVITYNIVYFFLTLENVRIYNMNSFITIHFGGLSMKRFVVALTFLFIIFAANSYSVENGLGVLQYNQNVDSKIVYTQKDVQQLANLGATAIRAVMLPLVNTMGAMQPILQMMLTMPLMQQMIPVAINPIESMVYNLAAPALQIATGRSPENIDGATLYDMINSGQPLQIIDVRTPGEWEQVRIPGAINIPMQNVEAAINSGKIKTDEPIVYICQSGARSYMVGVLTLTHSEFANTPVYNLEGGTIGAWVSKGFPTEGQMEEGESIIRGGC